MEMRLCVDDEVPLRESPGDTCPACATALARCKADHPAAYIRPAALRLIEAVND